MSHTNLFEVFADDDVPAILNPIWWFEHVGAYALAGGMIAWSIYSSSLPKVEVGFGLADVILERGAMGLIAVGVLMAALNFFSAVSKVVVFFRSDKLGRTASERNALMSLWLFAYVSFFVSMSATSVHVALALNAIPKIPN